MRLDEHPASRTEEDAENALSFNQVRQNVENKQKALLWEDARRGGASVDEFLWKGDPHAKPVQRAGLVIFALAFLSLAIVFTSIPFEKNFDDGWPIEFIFALILFLISARLIRNAFLRPPKH
jgi:hypothetical protein